MHCNARANWGCISDHKQVCVCTAIVLSCDTIRGKQRERTYLREVAI